MAGIAVPGTHLAFECTQQQLDQEMALIAATGTQWVRFDVAAVQIEVTQGGARNWSNIDRIVVSALSHGLTPQGILTTLPVWAAASWNTGASTPTQRTAFADFCTAAVSRYASSITYWEVWNEPNNAAFWISPSITDYTLLLQTAYPAIKAANSGAQVLVGGTAGGQSSPNNTTTWFTQLYASGGKNFFDIMNIHPYPDGGTDPVDATSGEMSFITALRSTMATNGDSAKKIWGTETGFPTSGANSTTEAKQAILIPQLISYWQTATGPQRGPLFIYTLRDLINSQPDREGYFGILHDDFSKKPAYDALTAVNAVAQ